ncbi:hypothetical protein T492DRAFT_834407 [Pavlovales sp. CCMP2436]|nr:hypothetical protein T492DRAFT_834407 [Pavlovales sp. CCMP2436]
MFNRTHSTRPVSGVAGQLGHSPQRPEAESRGRGARQVRQSCPANSKAPRRSRSRAGMQRPEAGRGRDAGARSARPSGPRGRPDRDERGGGGVRAELLAAQRGGGGGKGELLAVPPPSPTVAMDLSRVVWSVDWTLNGISLHDVYSERIPQPFATPHPKATAAGERARKFTTQGPGTREARVVLHWPSELFANTALAVHPSDRLSVLVKASYLPAGEVGEKAAPSTGMTGMAGMMGYGRKVKEVISGRLTPRIGFFGVKSEAAGAPLAGAALAQGKRFFTRAVVVQVLSGRTSLEDPPVKKERKKDENENENENMPGIVRLRAFSDSKTSTPK